MAHSLGAIQTFIIPHSIRILIALKCAVEETLHPRAPSPKVKIYRDLVSKALISDTTRYFHYALRCCSAQVSLSFLVLGSEEGA